MNGVARRARRAVPGQVPRDDAVAARRAPGSRVSHRIVDVPSDGPSTTSGASVRTDRRGERDRGDGHRLVLARSRRRRRRARRRGRCRSPGRAASPTSSIVARLAAARPRRACARSSPATPAARISSTRSRPMRGVELDARAAPTTMSPPVSARLRATAVVVDAQAVGERARRCRPHRARAAAARAASATPHARRRRAARRRRGAAARCSVAPELRARGSPRSG